VVFRGLVKGFRKFSKKLHCRSTRVTKTLYFCTRFYSEVHCRYGSREGLQGLTLFRFSDGLGSGEKKCLRHKKSVEKFWQKEKGLYICSRFQRRGSLKK